MSLRLQYWSAARDANRALVRLSQTVGRSGLHGRLPHLVYLRVSQINGCAFGVDLHYREALAEEDPRRLNAVAAWKETGFFSEQERAALAWAEALTRIETTGAPDDVFSEVRTRFDDEQSANLTFAISAIPAWNRLAVGFRRAPAEARPQGAAERTLGDREASDDLESTAGVAYAGGDVRGTRYVSRSRPINSLFTRRQKVPRSHPYRYHLRQASIRVVLAELSVDARISTRSRPAEPSGSRSGS